MSPEKRASCPSEYAVEPRTYKFAFCAATKKRREKTTTRPQPEQTSQPILLRPTPKMVNASLKGRYEVDKSSAAGAAAFNTAFNFGDVKLRASMTDATFAGGPSLNGLLLAVEKPGSFIIDYNVPKKDFRFQFMNSIRVAEKPLNLNYIHFRNDNRTLLDGTLVLDSANKVTASHVFGSGNCKLKYTYVHGGLTTIEPCYDVAKNSWDFAVGRKVYGDDVLRATYQTSSKVLGLEWARNSKTTGAFKISASLNLAEEVKMPKLSAESTWNFEM